MLSVNKHPFYTQHPLKFIFAYIALVRCCYTQATPWLLHRYAVYTPC